MPGEMCRLALIHSQPLSVQGLDLTSIPFGKAKHQQVMIAWANAGGHPDSQLAKLSGQGKGRWESWGWWGKGRGGQHHGWEEVDAGFCSGTSRKG